MTADEFLKEATATLRHADIPSARLDSLILLEDELGSDRATVLAHPETKITTQQLAKLNKKVAQRAKHVPLAYIRGRAPFFGHEFMVNEHVLVPRPETETMIEMLKKLPLPSPAKIIDIGTGSGCIGITAALELPGAEVGLYDIDPEALKLASQNAQSLRATVSCHQSDLLAEKPTADVILANLPYVPEDYAINQAAGHEPKHAIFAGKDGLGLYRRFWIQVADLPPDKPAFVLTEALLPQHNDLANLAKDAGYSVYQTQDFIQVFRRS